MEMKLVTRGIEASERFWIHLDAARAPHSGFARCGIAAEMELGPGERCAAATHRAA